jgi:transcriptional regulator with XRE-family HTH domain
MNTNTVSDNYTRIFIGENLRKLRKENKLTMTEVAKLLGKTRQGYMYYEKGIREISIKDLTILSGYYNVSIDVIVANPYSLKSDKTLAFRSFTPGKDGLEEIMPITISTIYDDVICYMNNTKEFLFFWKTNQNQVGYTMMFDYYDKIYVSKVYFKSNGGGHFYINDEPRYFNKAHSENIVFKGVLMAKLDKYIDIPHFFTSRF